MAELLHMPAPALPVGWCASSMFTGAWVRKVSTIPGLNPHDAVFDVHGPDAVVLLLVEEGPDGFVGHPFHHVDLRPEATLRAACEATEHAFCGCHVRV